MTADYDEGRWYIVVLVRPDGRPDGAISRTRPDDPYVWGLLTEEEATELAEKWTADPRDPSEPGTTAHVVEVYRFDLDDDDDDDDRDDRQRERDNRPSTCCAPDMCPTCWNHGSHLSR